MLFFADKLLFFDGFIRIVKGLCQFRIVIEKTVCEFFHYC
jgi:hypothetical protein